MINQRMLKLVGESEVRNMYLHSFKVFPPKTLNYKEKKKQPYSGDSSGNQMVRIYTTNEGVNQYHVPSNWNGASLL